jgi:uncharacterized protein (DUF1697 family)
MPTVVFLRGVNVGGHKKFQPSVLAKELTDFDMVNVGAAGTFVVRKAVSQTALRAELLRRLPFKAELMICSIREVLHLVDIDWTTFDTQITTVSSDNDMKRYVSVLGKRPRKLPSLPISQPAGDQWQVKIVAGVGKFALSIWRRQGKRLVYPNEVVEKNFGLAATTRNWNTIEAILQILRAEQPD